MILVGIGALGEISVGEIPSSIEPTFVPKVGLMGIAIVAAPPANTDRKVEMMEY